ncbi:MAG: hypothetical protein ACI80V_001710 [Rhodothermales bacterium]
MPDPATREGLKEYMESLVVRYESHEFIIQDPISIPLGFDDPRDQEIIALYAALLAWGRRETILKKMAELCERMDYRPHRFVSSFSPARDATSLAGFGHRTFRSEDAVCLTDALRILLQEHGTLEAVFRFGMDERSTHIGPAIQHFSESVMTAIPGTPSRLQKHLARPQAGSACKRLCMFLRWMVRPGPVDLGIWPTIGPSQLVLPLDVHSGRQARALGLLSRSSNDWRSALELTDSCRSLNADDPSRYDFALFGSGAAGEFLDSRFLQEPPG